MSDDFTAPDGFDMFDFLHEDVQPESIEGKVFRLKWTKDPIDKRYFNKRYFQWTNIAHVGSGAMIVICYEKKNYIERPHEITPDECYVHRGFNKQYKKRYIFD